VVAASGRVVRGKAQGGRTSAGVGGWRSRGGRTSAGVGGWRSGGGRTSAGVGGWRSGGGRTSAGVGGWRSGGGRTSVGVGGWRSRGGRTSAGVGGWRSRGGRPRPELEAGRRGISTTSTRSSAPPSTRRPSRAWPGTRRRSTLRAGREGRRAAPARLRRGPGTGGTDPALVTKALFDRVDAGDRTEAVTNALEAMRRQNLLGSERTGYEIQSSAAEEWERERRDVDVSAEQICELVRARVADLAANLQALVDGIAALDRVELELTEDAIDAVNRSVRWTRDSRSSRRSPHSTPSWLRRASGCPIGPQVAAGRPCASPEHEAATSPHPACRPRFARRVAGPPASCSSRPTA
jgi:hypothetical protein